MLQGGVSQSLRHSYLLHRPVRHVDPLSSTFPTQADFQHLPGAGPGNVFHRHRRSKCRIRSPQQQVPSFATDSRIIYKQGFLKLPGLFQGWFSWFHGCVFRLHLGECTRQLDSWCVPSERQKMRWRCWFLKYGQEGRRGGRWNIMARTG